MSSFPFDVRKFESVEQIGGIRTGTLDYPNPLGSQACRVAHVNTGGGLRFVVALDRGGDIVEAWYNQTNLTFLTANGYKPANPAYHHELEWLVGWPGGLVTTCGPVHVGAPRDEDGTRVSLHGRFSNTPAAVVEVKNPRPETGDTQMRLSLVTRDSRMFGPNVEVRRHIECALGQPSVRISDEVTNVGDMTCPHSMLYHVNLGYPLLDEGAVLVLQGQAYELGQAEHAASSDSLNALKTIPAPGEAHAGAGEAVLICDVPGDDAGIAHVGLINRRRMLAVEIAYPISALPRCANWQHFGPRGSYVTGLEPFSGTLVGKASDTHPQAEQWLQPGEVKRYELEIHVHSDEEGLRRVGRHDGQLTPVAS